jgi:hypothetical protein
VSFENLCQWLLATGPEYKERPRRERERLWSLAPKPRNHHEKTYGKIG